MTPTAVRIALDNIHLFTTVSAPARRGAQERMVKVFGAARPGVVSPVFLMRKVRDELLFTFALSRLNGLPTPTSARGVSAPSGDPFMDIGRRILELRFVGLADSKEFHGFFLDKKTRLINFRVRHGQRNRPG
jgi:hypothetical protein